MKLIKTLLLTTTAVVVAGSAFATNHFEGAYVGAQLGAAKATKTKSSGATSTDIANPAFGFGAKAAFKDSKKWALTGGILAGYREAVAQDILLGVSLGVDMNGTKFENSYNQSTTNKASAEVKQRYVVSLLGQAGYTVTKDVMPFITLGATYANFRFKNSDVNPTVAGTTKNKAKVGFAYGLGVAYAVNQTVSADLQYLGTAYGKTNISTQASGSTYTVTTKAPRAYHSFTVGVKYKI